MQSSYMEAPHSPKDQDIWLAYAATEIDDTHVSPEVLPGHLGRVFSLCRCQQRLFASLF